MTTATSPFTAAVGRRPARAGTLRDFLLTLVVAWQHRAGIRRQRRALQRMDARLLSDIGVTRAQALAEARRPAWDAPASWVDNSAR